MLRFSLWDMTVLIDFSAPAWLALLAIMLPRAVLWQTLAAALLHESAHLLAMYFTHQRPQSMQVSAAGLCLHMRADELCPLGKHCAVLLSGPLANLLAAAVFLLCGCTGAARAGLSLGVLNLLPFSGTDGGSLVYVLLSHRLLQTHPARILPTVRAVSLLTCAVLGGLFLAAKTDSLPLWGILLYLLAGSVTEREKKIIKKKE